MNKKNLIYKRIIEKISENNGFDELFIYYIENIYGCSSIRTKEKKRKQQRINKAKQSLKNFDNNLYLTKNSLVIISAHRQLLEDLDDWYFDESPPVEILSAKGEDGADLALIDSAEFILDSGLDKYFKEIIVASGDHIFSPLVEKLKNKRIKYKTVSSHAERVSKKILNTSDNHILLDSKLEYAA